MIYDLYLRVRYGKRALRNIKVLRHSHDEQDRRYALYILSNERGITNSFIRRNIYKHLYQEEIEMYENT